MDELVINRPLTNRDPIYGDPMTMAEREFSAFFNAVTELFGSEQAEASADDWLGELMASSDLPASPRQWRTLTVTAAALLASRVNASTLSKTPNTRIVRQPHPQWEERE
jgi:hypothetical protein